MYFLNFISSLVNFDSCVKFIGKKLFNILLSSYYHYGGFYNYISFLISVIQNL